MILENKGEQFILTKKHEKDIHVQVIGTTQGGHKESVSCRAKSSRQAIHAWLQWVSRLQKCELLHVAGVKVMGSKRQEVKI